MPPVTIVNETDEKLTLYSKSDVEASLTGVVSVSPRSLLEWGKIPSNFAWLRLAATRADGEWVFDNTYNWDELEQVKRRIVLSSLQPVTPPADVRVIPLPGAPPPVLPSPTVRPGSQSMQTPT